METDNHKLIKLVLALQGGVTDESLRVLQNQLDRCQNRESCDVQPSEKVWNVASQALQHGYGLAAMCNWMLELSKEETP